MSLESIGMSFMRARLRYDGNVVEDDWAVVNRRDSTRVLTVGTRSESDHDSGVA
jgi:hypothetical protein